jgi:GntR family transcriptional regulator
MSSTATQRPVRSRPVAEQVNEIIRERLRTQLYAPGERLPPESELSRELGVSRATLRTALAQLAAEGLILRKQGDGTFVNEHLELVNTSLGGMLDFWRLIQASGHEPSVETVSMEERAATTVESKILVIPEGKHIVSLTRLFRADQRAVILAENAVPRDLFVAGEMPPDGNLSLHEFLRRYCAREVEFAIYDIHSVLASGQAANLLDKPEGSPLLLLGAIFYDRTNQPIACGASHYDDTAMPLRFVQTWA